MRIYLVGYHQFDIKVADVAVLNLLQMSIHYQWRIYHWAIWAISPL